MGGGAGLPHFPFIQASGLQLLLSIPLALAGWLLALVFHASNRAFGALGARFRSESILAPVVAGVALGACALAFPNVLFSGEEQCRDIMGSWGTAGAFALIATGIAKVVATPLCLNLGWRGGNFFPCIFAGVSAGYGIAALARLDPMLCVLSVTTALIAGMTRKPLLSLALLLLCFPIDGILVSGIAAVVGAMLPIPSALMVRKSDAAKAGKEG